MGDCHLGGWRQPELKELNFKSFRIAIDRCINEKVDFVLIAGDLFDSAYPPIEILKDAFREFRRLKESNIPVFLIAGSHDYSVSGKTFLDVLEKSGFCKNVSIYEEKADKIILEPTLYKNVAIYGYPGKKSSMEVEDIKRIKLQDAPGLFKILMLHTAIRDAVPNIQIKAVDHENLPKVDYLALSHLHINYSRDGRVYSGPIFPNNLSELEELKAGSFYIFDNGKITKEEIKIREVLSFNLELRDGLQATEFILSNLEKENLNNKIIILKLYGILGVGKISDIDFSKIESYVKKQGGYVFLKSTTKLHLAESDIKLEALDSANFENQIITRFEETNPSRFNYLIPQLMKALQVEKVEDERVAMFEERVLSETKRLLQL